MLVWRAAANHRWVWCLGRKKWLILDKSSLSHFRGLSLLGDDESYCCRQIKRRARNKYLPARTGTEWTVFLCRYANVFLQPVTDDIAPGYHSIVQRWVSAVFCHQNSVCIFVGVSGNNVVFACCADLEKCSFSDMIQSEVGFPKNSHLQAHVCTQFWLWVKYTDLQNILPVRWNWSVSPSFCPRLGFNLWNS